MNILILTFADDAMREMADLTSQNKIEYAEIHGYDCIYEQRTIVNLGDGSGNGSWHKIPYLLKYIKHYDWILWSDADSLIMNFRKKLEGFLPADKGKDLIIGRDRQPWINAGNFFIRNCEWSINFLQLVQLHNWTHEISPDYAWWEQGAMRYLLEQSYHANHVDYVSCRLFNSYANFLREDRDLSWMKPDLYQYEDFMCHYSGLVYRNGVSYYQEVIQEMKRNSELINCN